MKKITKTALAILILSISLLPLFLIKIMYGGSYPVLGEDPFYNVEIMEDHKDALEHWLARGITNAVLVNIDAHDDMRPVLPEVLEKQKASYRQKRPGSWSATVSNSNFIHAAAKLGIVRKVYWVVPSTSDLFSDSGDRLAELLRMYGFPDRDAATFRLENGRYIGTADGIPLVICDMMSLPKLREPILLSVDVDYFPAMVSEDLSITKPLKETFKRLSEKRYELMDAVVSYSVNGAFMATNYRWVGDLVVDIIKHPVLLSFSQLPPRYTFLQKADLLLLMERYDELLIHLSRIPERDAADPSVSMYRAKAHLGLGNRQKPFEHAEEACLIDKYYCYGLPELGAATLASSGLAGAKQFFDRGYDLNPEMDHSQFNLAMALEKSGRHDEAIRYFRVFRDHYGPFPVDFYIAEIYHRKLDDASALKFYDSARIELARNPAAMAGFGDVGVIEAAAEFYERNGYAGRASELMTMVRRR